MNSVSMARRPAARAAAATSATLPCWSTMAGSLWLRPVTRRRGVVGPVAVLVEEPAGTLLVVALAVAADADAVHPVEQPDRQPRADEQGAALRRLMRPPPASVG